MPWDAILHGLQSLGGLSSIGLLVVLWRIDRRIVRLETVFFQRERKR